MKKPSKEEKNIDWCSQLINELNKNYGENTVTILSSENKAKVERVSTGILSLDFITGGGFPQGRIVEIYGQESSGKSTICLHFIAEAQKVGKKCMYIDTEHAFDPIYAENLGVNTKELIFAQPDYGEQALEILNKFLDSGKVGVVIVDSVAALVPKAELDGEMGESKMGLHARLMSQALRKITPITNKTGAIVVFINQLRSKIGVVFGNPEVTTGGNALKFYSSIRIDIRRTEIIKDGDESIANIAKLKIVKNKVAPPFKTALIRINYGYGYDLIEDLIELGVQLEIINKEKNTYLYNGNKLEVGKEKLKKLIEDNEELKSELIKKIKIYV